MKSAARAPTTSSEAVRHALRARQEVGLFDISPEGRHATGRPLFSASLPLGQLELEVFDRVPRLQTPLVLHDHGEGLTETARARRNHDDGDRHACFRRRGPTAPRSDGGRVLQ